MKTSDLIRKLQIIQETHGDNELSFGVKDYFHNGRSGGEPMVLNLMVGDDPTQSSCWFGVTSHSGLTRLEFHLKPQDGKNPKITYRK